MTWQAVAGAEGLDGSVIRPGEQDETLNNIRTDPQMGGGGRLSSA